LKPTGSRFPSGESDGVGVIDCVDDGELDDVGDGDGGSGDWDGVSVGVMV
jgi:hypothetical protein